MLVPLRKSNRPDCVVVMMSRSWLVGEGPVADEIDGLDLGRLALGDLEHEVHAVAVQLDDLGLHRGGEPALPAIDVEDALHVGLRAGAGEHASAA